MVRLTVHRLRQPLARPYRLSFATLTAFDSLIVGLAADGQSGFGEITPLPGYGEETIEGALAALHRALAALAGGRLFDTVVADLTSSDPMVASALVCARETQAEGEAASFEVPLDGPVPLTGLCGGATPDEAAAAARALVAAGYRHLKLKVGGGDIAADLERLRAVGAVLDGGAALSIDANQRLTADDARRLCHVAERLPVSLLEQPFPPEAWDAFARLAADTPLPLMLDESVWTAADVDAAAEAGARSIKLKLCKHPGLAASRDLIDHARRRGLGVVWGNGVQGAIGNHLEARVYRQCGLDSPGELNGVLKLAADPFSGRFSVSGGRLLDLGVPSPFATLAKRPAIVDHAFAL